MVFSVLAIITVYILSMIVPHFLCLLSLLLKQIPPSVSFSHLVEVSV